MRLTSILTAAALIAAPVAAGAQSLPGRTADGIAHGGPAIVRPALAHGAFRRFDLRDHRFARHDRERINPFLFGWWGAPWLYAPNCAYADACGEDASYVGGEADDVGAPWAPPPGRCGDWVMRGGRYVFSPGDCAESQPGASLSANECSDWVWSPRLRHSVCRRRASDEG